MQTFPLNQDRYPLFLRGKPLKIRSVELFALPKDTGLPAIDVELTPAGRTPDPASDRITLEPDGLLSGIPHKQRSYPQGQEPAPGDDWRLKIGAAEFEPVADALDDIQILVQYEVA